MSRLLKIFLIAILVIGNWKLEISVALAAATPLRPNPFELVPEESQKQFSPSKDQMTVGVAVGPGLAPSAVADKRNPSITFYGSVFSNFSRFITPLLFKSGQTGPGADTESSPGAPIGPTTSSCANTSGIFVYQSNPSWGNVKSPNHPEYDHCTIGLCGCGSASTTMILNSFGANTDVVSVWNHQHEIGGYAYYFNTEKNYYLCATFPDGPMQIFTESGLSPAYIGTGSDADWQEVETFLNNCGLIYSDGTAYWPSGNYGGHDIVISGIIKNSDGRVVSIKTLDPGTSGGDGLIRTLGAGSGDYAYEVQTLWAVTQ